jgi:hypothetical protein
MPRLTPTQVAKALLTVDPAALAKAIETNKVTAAKLLARAHFRLAAAEADKNGCFVFTGAMEPKFFIRNPNGVDSSSSCRTVIRVIAAAYLLSLGVEFPVPRRMRRLCLNQRCVNPTHTRAVLDLVLGADK